MSKTPLYIDNLQYANWSPALFEEMAQAHLAAVHVTICYHENFRQTVENMIMESLYRSLSGQADVWSDRRMCTALPAARQLFFTDFKIVPRWKMILA